MKAEDTARNWLENGPPGWVSLPDRIDVVILCRAVLDAAAYRTEIERLRTELERAYRALAAYTNARDKGHALPNHAIAYHSLTEAAAKRFVNHGALDGSEYFIDKSVAILHAALRGEDTENRDG